MPLIDALHRPLRNLRISVTDRCNLRCAYCMPEDEYAWLPRGDILSFEEHSRLADVFARLGVDKVRLTGGEPLLRRDLPVLVKMLSAKASLRDLALTTNGMLLEELARPLAAAGLSRITVSIDTLQSDRFRDLTRRDELPRVLRGIEAAAEAWPGGVKLDTVVMRGVNDDELEALLAYGRGLGAEVRFIEYMDVGGATRWSRVQVVPRTEMLERIGRALGPVAALPKEDTAPAERFRLGDGTIFGVISSTTAPFCSACDRARLTADGMWYLCLYARLGLDLRGPLRRGASDEELAALITRAWLGREERGAEERLAAHDRDALVRAEALVREPHREMHVRGG